MCSWQVASICIAASLLKTILLACANSLCQTEAVQRELAITDTLKKLMFDVNNKNI